MKDNMPGTLMPDISFERSMNHNYMILSKCGFFGKADDHSGDYRAKMLLENRIQGLLPVTHRLINGESRYYYEINSLQSLDRLYARTEIRYDMLRRLLSGCVSLFDRLEEYLLDGTQVIIKPDLIYIDVEKMEPYFVCYPDYEGDVRMNFMEFIEELLTRIDHTDEQAVMLGYQIYRYTRRPNYVISEIGNMISHASANITDEKVDIAQRDVEPARSFAPYPVKNSMSTMNDKCVDNCITRQNHFDTYSCEEGENTEDTCSKPTNNMGNVRSMGLYPGVDLIGGFFCVFLSLCAGAIVLGAHLIPAFQLGENNALYLYGVIGMALVAAVLFFSCYLKKRRQAQGTELPDDDGGCEEIQYYTAVENGTNASGQDTSFSKQSDYQNSRYTEQSGCNETMFLGDCVVEERMLCGRINGREVNIALDKLPMTVGKLANVSDVVINDTSVSKMHARFEERGGRVYICDLNSTNGTIHNGALLEINQSVMLEPGDRLRFGRTSFTYC